MAGTSPAMTSVWFCLKTSCPSLKEPVRTRLLGPKVLARQLRALHQHAKLKPRHLRMDGAKAHKCAEAAIGARHHALAADKTGIALDPLSDEFWMLEHVRLGLDDARDDDLIGRKLDLLEQRPFV